MKPIKPVAWLWLLGLIVLGVLVLVLWPFLQARYTGSPGTICLSNLKQVMTSISIYEADSDDCLPPYFSFDGTDKTKAFMAANHPYIKNDEMYNCPLEKENIQAQRPSAPSNEGLPGKMDYAHCLSLMGEIPEFSAGKRVFKEAEVLDPSKTPYLRDVIRGYDAKETQRFLSSHGPSFAEGFIDSHVKSVKLEVNRDL